MSAEEAWEVVLFQSVSQAIRAEKLLLGEIGRAHV